MKQDVIDPSGDNSGFHKRIVDFVRKELRPIETQVETSGVIPEAIVEKMRWLGLFGMAIPEAYGGLGLSTQAEIKVYETLTRANACFRSRIGTSNSIGSMGILYDGTDEQKQSYLPRIASGEWTAAFALTEPDAGSDASNISTTAKLEGDHWILNGTKQFITNADCATVFTTIALTDEEKRTRGGVTALIVEKDMPGLMVGRPDRKMGIKGSQTCELVFKNRIEIFMRDVRLYRLFEGTSEIQRLVISRNLLKGPSH